MITLDRLDNELDFADRENLVEQIAIVRDEIYKQLKRFRKNNKYDNARDYIADLEDLATVANCMVGEIGGTKSSIDRIVDKHGFEAEEILEAITTKYIERLAFGW